MATRIVAVDFETQPIQPLPDYPPKPTMLGLYEKGKSKVYLSWGHPSGNNCTEDVAKGVLKTLWDDPDVELVGHNTPFDVLVAHVHWGLPIKRAGLIHDTMVMAFLLEPHAMTYALKPMADKLLGLPPDESDAIRTWCQENGLIKKNAKEYGEHMSKVPAEIVGPYCIGDVVRTMQLFDQFMPQIIETGMLAAYHRELKVHDIMLESTRDGVSVNVDGLRRDVELYDNALSKIDELILTLLQCESFNLDSDAQLADAIDKAHPGLVWSYTKTGKRSTSKANMEKTLEGLTGVLLAAMQYRASIKTCVNTFLRPWLLQATHPLGGGKMRCQWNTTRSDDGGARTGRLSSSPSLMNIPTLASAKFTAVLDLWDKHLKQLGFPALPNVRSYITPDKGDELISYDYSSQELRVLAHYESDMLLKAYQEDPTQDLHQYAADLIAKQLGIPFKRKQAKTCAFAILYGSGLSTLAAQLGSTVDEAGQIKGAYLTALPGVKGLIDSLKHRASINKPIRTWGGRLYYVEPPRIIDGRQRTFDYKLLNYLCQGGSADITKEAIINYDENRVHGRLILTVHDQIVITVPTEHWQTEAKILQRCMESVPLDAKLVADGSHGPNLHNVEDFK